MGSHADAQRGPLPAMSELDDIHGGALPPAPLTWGHPSFGVVQAHVDLILNSPMLPLRLTRSGEAGPLHR